MSNILLDLESSFSRIEDGLRNKTESINQQYDSNVKKLSRIFYSSGEFSTFSQSINEQRDVLLNKIYEARNNQLIEFNNLVKKLLILNRLDLDIINRVKIKIFNDLKVFKSKNSFNFDSVLTNHSFINGFDFYQFSKYSKFMVNKKRLKLKLKSGFSIQHLNNKDDQFFKLSHKRYFICAKPKNECTKMMVLNSRGSIMYSKELNKKSNKFKSIFKQTSSYIIHLFESFQNSNSHTTIKVYNFKLETVFTFNLKNVFLNEIIVNSNKNEFALQNLETSKILIYNLDTLQSSHIKLKTEAKNDRLIHFNDEKLYFFKLSKLLNYIYVIDRLNGSKLSTIPICDNQQSVKFDKSSHIYYADCKNRIAKVYTSDGKLLYKVLVDQRIMPFSFTGADSIIYSQRLNGKYLEFDEY